MGAGTAVFEGSGPVAVTGAAGFVGCALVHRLQAVGRPVRAVVRRSAKAWPSGVEEHALGDIDARTEWAAVLQGCDAVVHCAARAHQLQDAAEDPLAEFRRVNTQATLHLADAAQRAGVRRFIFVSTIGVNGAQTREQPFRAEDPPAPHSPYALSKLEAETGLRALADRGPMEWTIVRPPMVYGPDAPGNFARLLKAVQSGWPLPLGAVNNRRSLVARRNLVDLLARCIDHPAAANSVWLVSDGADVSTTELLLRLAAALGVPPRLLPLPGLALQALARLIGRRDIAQSLFGSLQIDMQATCRRLQWSPPFTMEEELAATAIAFRSSRHPT